MLGATHTTHTPAATPERRSLQCESCGAQLEVEARDRTTRCPYCAAPAVIERPPATNPVEPTFAVGFVITRPVALQRARQWVKKTWFTPRAFKRSDFEEIRGVYVPAYLYSGAAEVTYQVQIGENYTVTETYVDANGKTRTRTRIETEWRHLQGRWASFVDDLVVTASSGLANDALESIEPFDMRALRRFSPKLVSGWLAEEPSMDPSHCMQLARQEAVAAIGRRLSAHMPGDSHRNLRYQTTMRHEDLELVLVPVWILAIRYDPEKAPVRLLINGQTGKVNGTPPRSWPMIVGTVVGVILVLVLLGVLLSS